MELAEYALIVAGGSGSRMGLGKPKQFMELGGRPILMRTIDVFISYNPSITIVLVLPKDQFEEWRTLCQKHYFQNELEVVSGGSTRYESVKKGLELVDDNCIVAIHDGVRPFVDQAIINNSFHEARRIGNAVASVPLKDSIRKVLKEGSQSVDRINFRLIQTPQTFRASVIKMAYKAPYRAEFTDDASVAESVGVSINLIEGSYDNIKITTPEDGIIAEALFISKKNGHT